MRVDECRSAGYALMAFAGMEYGKFEETNLREVPREVYDKYKDKLPLNWRKRAEHWYTEFDRVQRGAEAVFSNEGRAEILANIEYYRENAKTIAKTLDECNIKYFGGKHSPYIWLKCPNNMTSWEFFDFLLNNIQVVGTPGEGFGKNGEGFFRLTSFGSQENTKEAMERLKNLLLK